MCCIMGKSQGMFSGRTWRWVSNPDPHPHPISILVPCDLHGAPQWHGSGPTTLSVMAHVYIGACMCCMMRHSGMFSCRTWRCMSQHVQARQPACCFFTVVWQEQTHLNPRAPLLGHSAVYHGGTGAGAVAAVFPPAFVRVCVCVRQLAQASRFRVAHANFDFRP